MTGKRITTIAENGPPPDEAAVIYGGSVMHQRLKPFRHRFSYDVFYLLLDIDRLDEIRRTSRLLAIDRAGLLSFRQRDHLSEGHGSLREEADAALRSEGLPAARRVTLMCFPRMFGYVFNPISLWFCYDAGQRLTAMIYEVRSTFGERHLYVEPVLDGQLDERGLRQERGKRLHVSPFISMNCDYRFQLLPPGESLRLRINQSEDGSALLAATFVGRRSVFGDRALLSYLARFPFLTFKVMGAIHWEALKLWLSGARIFNGKETIDERRPKRAERSGQADRIDESTTR